MKMCQIQFVKTFDGTLDQEDFDSFLNMMDQGSLGNGDAWGIHNDKSMVKEPGMFFNFKQRDKLFKNICEGKSFLVGHNRFATQGAKEDNKNNHPFESEDFFMVHNGVISNDDTLQKMKELFYEEVTDSAVILQLIQALKNKGYSTVKAIKKTAEMLEGSFSVFVYDKKAKKLYYFKNKSTNFSFALVERKGRTLLFGSTDNDNFNEVYNKNKFIFNWGDYDLFVEKEALSGVIYEINKREIKTASTFKPKKRERSSVSSWNGAWGIGSGSQKEDELAVMTLWDKADEIRSMIETEGFKMRGVHIDYKARTACFEPSEVPTTNESATIFMILENQAFYEDGAGFVVSEEDMDNILLMNSV